MAEPDPHLLGNQILITLGGMILGYGLTAMFYLPQFDGGLGSLLGGIAVLFVLACTTVRWLLVMFLEMLSASMESIIMIPIMWGIGMFLITTLMPFAFLAMLIQYWRAKRQQASRTTGTPTD